MNRLLSPGQLNIRGFVLLPVVIAIALIATIAFLNSEESGLELKMAVDEFESTRAEYVTQAAMQHAEWALRQQGCGPFSDLASTNFGNHSYSATIIPNNAGGLITTYNVAVSDDALIKKNTATQNYGNVAQLETFADWSLTDVRRALYRFDIASAAIPAGSFVMSAVVRLFVIDSNNIADVNLHRITADWTEGTVNWDNINTGHDASAAGSIPVHSLAGQFVEVNVTPLVQGWINGSIANQGIMLKSTTNLSDLAQFSSKEYGTTSQRPELIIKVSDGSLSNLADITATGTLSSGPTLTITRKDIDLFQSTPGAISLQLGTDAGEDAMLDSFYDLRNYGGADYLQVHDNKSDWKQYPLIRFNLDGLPHGASVLSAQLELNLQSLISPGKARIHQVTRSWVEGTKAGGGTADGATWFTHDGSNAWTSAGGDFNPEVIAETTINGGETWVSWEIATLVERWLAGEPNYGLIIKPDSALNQANFASREDANIGVQPKLTITYTCQCGITCQAPQGSGKIALIGDDATPDSDDQVKIAIIESWGYEVDFYQDTDSNTIIWSDYDLAYVSETVISGDVSADLANVSIGVVNEEPRFYDDLDLASGDTQHVGSSIEIIDNSHFITSLFPSGSFPIYTDDMEILSANAPLATDLQILGEFGGAASLTTIEKGSQTITGTAAGRRVTLPLGQHFASGFDWTRLNNNGRLIVQRAIQWGTGNTGEIIANLLLVVVNPASLTSQESAKKTLFEGWGYHVNLIDESDTQADFDTAIGNNDVAYIPQDIDANNLGNKLSNATIGVVNEDGEQVDEQGFSQNPVYKTRDQIDIIDNSHYITQPFSTGLLTFVSSTQSVHMLSGTLAPGLSTLAQSFNIGSQWQPSLAILQPGADLWNGGTAAGRRVQLPWGGATFDINQLTDDGRLILQRSLEWAASPAGPLLPIAHWKLDDAAGTTAVDSESAHNGTLINMTPDWVTGQVEGALDFDGVNDYINVPHNNALSLTDTMTFMAWINPAAIGTSYNTVLAKDPNTSESSYWFGLYQDELDFGFFSGGFYREVFTSGLNVQAGSWQHISASFDNATNEVLLYLDGVLVHTGTMTFSPATNTADLTIGRSPTGEYWNGMLDDVRIYNTVLSATEINDIFTSGSGGGTPDPFDCNGTYRDEFSIQDFNGSNGTIDWSTTPWSEIGDDDNPVGGDIQVINDVSNYQLQIKDKNRGVERPVNLAGASTATLKFNYRRQGLDNGNDEVRIYASSTGIGGPWTELPAPIIEGSGTDGSYQAYERDISAFISADSAIRLLSNNLLGNSDKVFFDDLRVECSP